MAAASSATLAHKNKDGFFRLMARGLALFLAIYVLLSFFAIARDGFYNLNAWWIDLRFLPQILDAVLQLILAIALFVFAIFTPSKLVLKLAVGILFFLFCIFATINTFDVYRMAAAGEIRLGFPIPFSLFIAIAFLLLAIAAITKRPTANGATKPRFSRLRTIIVMTLSVVLCGVLFPLGQVYCFGKTEYRMPVDAVVILGAHVYPDGTLSYAVQDRVDKGILLYNEGITPLLIMSGGVDSVGTNESQEMRDYAVAQGVPSSAIIVDSYGNSTEDSAKNVIAIMEERNLETLGATSSYYHMARIKMLFLANGHDVFTFPADYNKENGNRVSMPREIPGWWYYWFRAALGI